MKDEERFNKFKRYIDSLVTDTQEKNFCTQCGHLQAKHQDRRLHCFEIEYEQGCFGPRGRGTHCYCWNYKSPHPPPLDEHINLIEQ